MDCDTNCSLPAEADIHSDAEFMDLLAMCYGDSKKYCKTFYPNTFSRPFNSLHSAIFDLVDNSDARKKAVAASRGIGKTSIAKALACKSVHYRRRKFVPYVSKSETHAMEQTEDIKDKLKNVEIVKKVFGEPKILDYTPDKGDWSKKAFVAFDTLVMPRGWKQQLRGLNWRDNRPDFPIFDDLEDDEEILNEEIRKKLKERFYSGAQYSVPQHHEDWEMFYIDTIKHEDSLLVELVESPEWETIELGICDDSHKTLAPDFMSQGKLNAMVAEHRRNKTMDIFAREFMSVPMSREDATFKASLFQYYEETDEIFVKRCHQNKIISVVIIDPAKTVKMHNAQSGIVAWGIDVENRAMYVREARGEFYHPDELYCNAIETAKRYDAQAIGVEITGLEEFIKHPFKNAMTMAGLYFEPVWLKARSGKGEFSGLHGGKAGRVAGLLPYYRQGLVYHNSANCSAYEMQLLGFPRSKRWDIMDAAAYIVEMLEQGLIYFQHEYDDTDNPKEDEYSDLVNEPVEEAWRYAY